MFRGQARLLMLTSLQLILVFCSPWARHCLFPVRQSFPGATMTNNATTQSTKHRWANQLRVINLVAGIAATK